VTKQKWSFKTDDLLKEDTILEEDHPMSMTIPSKLVLIELLVPDKMVFM
jgi:hypothetical protein